MHLRSSATAAAFATVLCTAATAQTLVIPAGDTVSWVENLPDFESLEVYGHLRVYGGTGETRPLILGRVQVLEGGALSMKHVGLAYEGERDAALTAAPGSTVSLDDVDYDGRDVQRHTDAAPYVDLRATGARVVRSDFAGQGTLLSVSGSDAEVADCRFRVSSGTALELAPAGLARDLTVSDCAFEIAGADATGVTLRSPYAAISRCKFEVLNAGTGVDIGPLPAYAEYPWATPDQRCGVFESEFSQAARPMGTGLSATSFPGAYMSFEALHISGFAAGARLVGPALEFRDGRLRGNRVGVLLDGASLTNTEIFGGTDADIAVSLEGPHGGSYLEDVTCESVATGLHIASDLERPCRLLDWSMAEVEVPVSYGAAVKTATLYANRPLIQDDAVTSSDEVARGQEGHAPAQAHGDHSGHAHHHGPPASTSVVVTARGSAMANPQCTALPDADGWVSCPLASTGRLTVATGHGLSDPIHEHGRPLGAVLVALPDGAHAPAEDGRAQEVSFELAGDRTYDLELPSIENLYDLYLGWQGTVPVQLRLRYPHKSPVVLRALGRLMPSVSSADALAAAESSCYFVSADVIEIRLVPTSGPEEAIVYTRNAEIPLAGSSSEQLSLRQPEGSTLGRFAVEIAGGEAAVTITDLFSVALAPTQTIDATGGVFDVSAFHGDGGWIFVETEEGYFKGPLLTPAEPILSAHVMPEAPVESSHHGRHGGHEHHERHGHH